MAKKKATKEKTKSLEDILFACRDALRGKAQMIDKRDVLLTLPDFITFLCHQIAEIDYQVVI